MTPVTDVLKQTMNAATPSKHEGSTCDQSSCSAPQLPVLKTVTAAASKGGPSSQPSPEPHALLALATKIVGDYDMNQDRTAIPMRTVLSPLALQGLRMIAYNGTQVPATTLFALILQFMTGTEAATKPSPQQALAKLAPPNPQKPKWMSETQAGFFAFHSNKPIEARHASFWLNKKLPYSMAPAHMRSTCGVSLFTAMQKIQALRDQLSLANSLKTPEEVLDHVMSLHATINTAAPSQAMLEVGRTNVRPAFAQSLSTLFQRDLTLTIAYALLKFGLDGCTGFSSSKAEPQLPACDNNQVQVDTETDASKEQQPNRCTAMHDTDMNLQVLMTIIPPAASSTDPSFIKLVLDFLHDTVDLADVQETYAKTYAAMHVADIGLRCFPPVLHLFDRNHDAVWSAAYDNSISLQRAGSRSAQAQAQHLISHVYGAHTVASIARQHARLAQEDKIIVTLPYSKWSLWDAILTGAGLRPLGYSLAHTLALMARSSHSSIVTKTCGDCASLGGGHYIHDTDLAPIMVNSCCR